MVAEHAVVVPFGRPSKARLADLNERIAELEEELAARDYEAVALVDAVTPLVRRLLPGAIELGPAHQQTVVAVLGRLSNFRRQQFPDPEDAA